MIRDSFLRPSRTPVPSVAQQPISFIGNVVKFDGIPANYAFLDTENDVDVAISSLLLHMVRRWHLLMSMNVALDVISCQSLFDCSPVTYRHPECKSEASFFILLFLSSGGRHEQHPVLFPFLTPHSHKSAFAKTASPSRKLIVLLYVFALKTYCPQTAYHPSINVSPPNVFRLLHLWVSLRESTQWPFRERLYLLM